mgnify:CR=1 FL=1|tara:strand:+ start:3306 stop:3770 length:465 start_codon:yes stop_codon:yes gene_type:complete
MAAGIGNPLGYVAIGDGENPRTIAGVARAEVISGGVFVFGSTATGVVGSQTASFNTTDFLMARDASGLQCTGMALQDTGSNEALASVTRGTILVPVIGSVIGGYPVGVEGTNEVSSQPWIATASPAVFFLNGKQIGRAVCDGASGGYVAVHLNL